MKKSTPAHREPRPRKARDHYAEITAPYFCLSTLSDPLAEAVERTVEIHTYGFRFSELPKRLQGRVARELLAVAERMRELRRADVRLDDIAEQLHTTRRTVQVLLWTKTRQHLLNGAARPTYAELVRAYDNGRRTIREVAELTGEQPSRIRSALSSAGVSVRSVGAAGHRNPRRTDQKIIDSMIEMRKRGRSLQQVGKKFGLSKERVRQLTAEKVTTK